MFVPSEKFTEPKTAEDETVRIICTGGPSPNISDSPGMTCSPEFTLRNGDIFTIGTEISK